MARLYSNENFPYAVVKQLRRLGHDVITNRIHKFLESFDSLSGKLVRVNRPVQ